MKPELAPDRALGYQIADLVIISSLPSGGLSAAKEQALTHWVQAGGTLVVTSGADLGALRSPAMRALLPVEATGTIPLAAAGALRALSVSTAVPPAAAPGQVVATACRPRPGAAVDARTAAGVPLLCSWPRGDGQVVFSGAGPHAAPPARRGCCDGSPLPISLSATRHDALSDRD